MKRQLPIGLSDYKTVIDDNYYYIDKTLLIDEIMNRSGIVKLIPRPRRFGKTLNLSMLRYFFEKNYHSAQPNFHAHLFEDKKIWQMAEMRVLQGKFPVIFITFKSVKETNWQKTYKKLSMLIADEYRRHQYLLDGNTLDVQEKQYFQLVASQAGDETDYQASLGKLSVFLERHHAIKTIILIDEYDAPIHEAFLQGFYKEATGFMRGFLGDGLKDNTSLERSVITGILRTAKEGIFSGLNNLEVCTILDQEISDKFGFTQEEINQLLKDYDLTSISQDFKSWYNGYLIGNTKMYNPWSALNCVNKKGILNTYWVNTSDNALVTKIIATANEETKKGCTKLLSGDVLDEVIIMDKMVLPGMLKDSSSIWSLLLFSGYVTVAEYREKGPYSLTLPNLELRELFQTTIMSLFKESLGESDIPALEESVRNVDGELFEELLSNFITQSMSCHDISSDEPEKSYHLFILGLLVALAPRYAVRSNREAGRGRYDIVLIPHDKSRPGLVIEFKKKGKKETMEECTDRAMEQIKERKYAVDLQALGISKIGLFGIAIHKKDVLLKQELA